MGSTTSPQALISFHKIWDMVATCLSDHHLILSLLMFDLRIWSTLLPFANFAITNYLYSICYYVYVVYIISPRKHAQFPYKSLKMLCLSIKPTAQLFSISCSMETLTIKKNYINHKTVFSGLEIK